MRSPNVGNDRAQLANMAGQAKAAMGTDRLDVLADRGYFSGEEVLACEPLASHPTCPSRSPQAPRPRDASASRTSSTWPTAMSIAVQPASD